MLRVCVQKRLADFTLEVAFEWEKGILVVSGPSGAGKTTLLHCLAGLARPDRGRIELAGRPLFDSREGIDLPPQKRRVGYVFQDYALFPHLTVRENVLYGLAGRCKCGESRHRLGALELLEMLHLAHLQDRYPSSLSGGERQRVCLVRALATAPDLLLLDEPWCALDGENRAAVQRQLRELEKRWDIPFVLVTHDRREAENLGRMVLFLDRGRERRAGGK